MGIAGLCIYRSVWGSRPFLERLARADSLIAQERKGAALRGLARMVGHARESSQYLSIAKRQMELSASAAALRTLQRGIRRSADDGRLAALVIHLLLREARFEEAISYVPRVVHKGYESIGAEALIKAALTGSRTGGDSPSRGSFHSERAEHVPEEPVEFSQVQGGRDQAYVTAFPLDRGEEQFRVEPSPPIRHTTGIALARIAPALWLAAFGVTGMHAFLQNAACAYARVGELHAAFRLYSRILGTEAPENTAFWATVAYDAGQFSLVFELLPISLARADLFGTYSAASTHARTHLLLAADAAFDGGDRARARAFWYAYVDRFPGTSIHALYNLALTAPHAQERVRMLAQCVEGDKTYYPAVACYARESIAFRAAHRQRDSVTELLSERGVYSVQMEQEHFLSPHFPVEARSLLAELAQEAMHGRADVRFALEYFRFCYPAQKRLQGSRGALWQLLEVFPVDTQVRRYARWFFFRIGEYESAFGLSDAGGGPEDAFYRALAAASRTGRVESILGGLVEATRAVEARSAAFANIAIVLERMGKKTAAAEHFVLAADEATRESVRQLRKEAGEGEAEEHPRARPAAGKAQRWREWYQHAGQLLQQQGKTAAARALLQRAQAR